MFDYSTYFKAEQQAKAVISLANGMKQGFDGQVRTLNIDLLSLELFGSNVVGEQLVEVESEVSLSTFTGWSLCRCKAVVAEEIHNRMLTVRLMGPVSDKQTREYFRLDVSLPLIYSLPVSQNLSKLHVEWVTQREATLVSSPPVMKHCLAGYKVTKWNGVEVEPKLVNLSAGGIRFKTSESMETQALVAVQLFLPLPEPKAIHVVAEVLRCNEILLSRLKGNNFNVAMRYRMIHEKDRDSIVAYINEEQRRMLRIRAGIELQYGSSNQNSIDE